MNKNSWNTWNCTATKQIKIGPNLINKLMHIKVVFAENIGRNIKSWGHLYKQKHFEV